MNILNRELAKYDPNMQEYAMKYFRSYYVKTYDNMRKSVPESIEGIPILHNQSLETLMSVTASATIQLLCDVGHRDDNTCIYKYVAKKQRYDEYMIHDTLLGTEGYEKMGCYGSCDGKNESCDSYLLKKRR